jgi:alpha-glucosidase
MPADLKVSNLSPQVQGTRGHQLAMYVVFENHLPMLADYPEAFQGQGGFEFLTTVPANWDETRVLMAELDRVLVVARRRGNVWYLGGMTGDKSASVDLPLAFLGDGDFTAELLLDAAGDDPTKLENRQLNANANASLRIEIPAGGGFVATVRQKK